jgi:hypothetical protein
MQVWKKMATEWLSDDEWQFEWQLFEMLEEGFIEAVGLDKFGEVQLKFTEKYYSGYIESIAWDDMEDDD